MLQLQHARFFDNEVDITIIKKRKKGKTRCSSKITVVHPKKVAQFLAI